AALLAALDAPRTGPMRDIVATIQAEQDEIIRLDHTGITVIEGGPGTGKTAVALHRVAYLLFTHPQLARRGVLVLGPNPRFLTHISAVLPSLGETDVVFATPGELLPGVATDVEDTPHAARVKGSLAMVDVLAAAVADREEVPDEPVPIELEDVTVEVTPELAAAARDRARALGLRHNEARGAFATAVLDALADQAVDRIGAGVLARPATCAPTPARSCAATPACASWSTRSGRSSPRSGCSPTCSPPRGGSTGPPPRSLPPTGPRWPAPTATPGPSRTCRCSTRPPSCSVPRPPSGRPRGRRPRLRGGRPGAARPRPDRRRRDPRGRPRARRPARRTPGAGRPPHARRARRRRPGVGVRARGGRRGA